MSDTKEEILCPACKEKMTKIMTDANVNIDICINGCGGIWFDNREIEKFSDKDENFEKLQKIISEKEYKAPTIDENRICPVCKTKMVQHKAANSDIVIDECYNCGGKFLDFGELEKIKNSSGSKEDKINQIEAAIYSSENRPHKENNNKIRKFLEKLYIERF